MTMPSTELRNALPDAWIDRLFMRFATLYGRQWLDLWAHVPMDGVKAAWAESLAGLTAEQVRMGLEHCQRGGAKFPPTAPEFAGICRGMRAEPAHRALLSAPRMPMPGHIREQLRAFVAKANVTPE